MFNNARNIKVKDGSFTVNVGTTQQDKLGPLFDAVSLNAVLNAGGRADEVRCYPGTREEIIGKVERWMDGQSEPSHRMLWLSGPAGAGKSAIAQTVAERGAKRGVHASNFFFFRGDNSRNHPKPLVATLIYQLIKFYPSLRDHLNEVLTTQPLAYRAAVGEQFAYLLGSPIENVYHSSTMNHQIVLIVDGLDECNDEAAQLQILDALHTLVSRNDSPFRVFVASRAEAHLVRVFNKIGGSVESIFLNDEYRPEDDIRRFVIAKFDEIKRTHHLAHTLSGNWPAEEDIHKIVNKSSGQFVYAATVMRFIEYSKDSPALSLLTVHEIRPPTTHSPFSQLDALYSYVFSKARDIRLIKWAIGFYLMKLPYTGKEMLRIAGYEAIDLHSLLADISAIAMFSINQYGQVEVKFYHASLPDYLKNKSRSAIYNVDESEICTDTCIICLEKLHDPYSLDIFLHMMSKIQQPTTELSKSLLNVSAQKLDHNFCLQDRWSTLVFTITNLYFEIDEDLCGCILRGWLRFAYMHKLDPTIEERHFHAAVYNYFERLRVIEMSNFVVKPLFNG